MSKAKLLNTSIPKVTFADKYPDIELELIISYELLNLSKREADVAIRACFHPPEHLVGKQVIRCAYFLLFTCLLLNQSDRI
ncbi:MAG: hypothetical protein QNJ72_28180 [Pleurocapsa sp. MO_226.B13]|nr:hypothetical protein [Pleurocapsa sp. MO_226.B13]